MKEKILNITLYIEYIIYIIVALILKFVFKQNILFKGWYLIIFIIPILTNIIFRKKKINNILLLIALICIEICILNIININRLFIILLSLAIIYVSINIISNILSIKNYNESIDVTFYHTLFGEDYEKLNNIEFKGCNIWSIFGSTTLDLVNAKIEDNAVIKVFNLLGSTNIITKDDINIIKNGKTIIGESKNTKDNKTRKKNKTILIENKTILGSLRIG